MTKCLRGNKIKKILLILCFSLCVSSLFANEEYVFGNKKYEYDPSTGIAYINFRDFNSTLETKEDFVFRTFTPYYCINDNLEEWIEIVFKAFGGNLYFDRFLVYNKTDQVKMYNTQYEPTDSSVSKAKRYKLTKYDVETLYKMVSSDDKIKIRFIAEFRSDKDEEFEMSEKAKQQLKEILEIYLK